MQGSLLAGSRLNIIDENHYAGSPDNLYRACLHINGVPKTWKYILTQFSDKRIAQNLNTINKERIVNLILHEVLMKGFRLVQILMEITVRRVREHSSTRKPISFIRYFFHKKLIFGMQTINEKMIQNLKPIIDGK
ncbi:uncharacterized protein LOC113556751 [Rhopalosiphum maidis]|uniref:uncharacterized protein LOC113556751 n=1 Tax=Rhopalosiphum maidis TaxID=43146 RepID=UPI000EFE4DB5|nr:uncharacterized protein LOC113556751 [Rhopalosiphum maidis]